MKTRMIFVVGCIAALFFVTPDVSADETKQDATELRDPFKSLIEKPEVAMELIVPDVDEKAAALQKIKEVKQLKLIGIIQGELGDYGIVLAPDGKTYMVTVGTLMGIFGGKVITITDNTVVIKETKQFKTGDDIETKEIETSLLLKPLEKTEVQAEEKVVATTIEKKPSSQKKHDETNRREPFKSLLENPEVPRELIIPERDEKKLSALQKVENIKQLKVVGIIQGELRDTGMVDAPDGKTYMVTVGTLVGIFDGKVTSITANAVVIKETKQFKTGDNVETKEVETALRLKPLEEEEQL